MSIIYFFQPPRNLIAMHFILICSYCCHFFFFFKCFKQENLYIRLYVDQICCFFLLYTYCKVQRCYSSDIRIQCLHYHDVTVERSVIMLSYTDVERQLLPSREDLTIWLAFVFVSFCEKGPDHAQNKLVFWKKALMYFL